MKIREERPIIMCPEVNKVNNIIREIIIFYSANCPQCEKKEKWIEETKAMGLNYEIRCIDIGTPEGISEALMNGIRSVPSILDKKSKQVWQLDFPKLPLVEE